MQHGIEVLDEYPIAGFAAVVAVAALAYAAITYVMDGAVNVLATVIFAVVFTAVYVGFSWYVDRRNRESPDTGGPNAGGPNARGSNANGPERK